MNRIRLRFPELIHFETEIEVRISDLNYGGHLGNDAVMRLMHEVRVQFYAKYGYTEFDIEGYSTIMSDAAIIYKVQGFYGDKLKVNMAMGTFGRCGFDLFYQFINSSNEQEVVLAKTAIVFFDYDSKKLKSVPLPFKKHFMKNER